MVIFINFCSVYLHVLYKYFELFHFLKGLYAFVLEKKRDSFTIIFGKTT